MPRWHSRTSGDGARGNPDPRNRPGKTATGRMPKRSRHRVSECHDGIRERPATGHGGTPTRDNRRGKTSAGRMPKRSRHRVSECHDGIRERPATGHGGTPTLPGNVTTRPRPGSILGECGRGHATTWRPRRDERDPRDTRWQDSHRCPTGLADLVRHSVPAASRSPGSPRAPSPCSSSPASPAASTPSGPRASA